MINPADFTLWTLSTLLCVYVFALIAFRGQSRRYLSLSIFFLVVAATEMIRLLVLLKYGFVSAAYKYFYFEADCINSIFMFFAIAGLFQKTALPGYWRRQLRIASVVLPVGIAALAFLSVLAGSGRILMHFIFEYSAALTVACAVLAVVLCSPSLWHEKLPKHARQIAFIFAVYMALFIALWKLNSFTHFHARDTLMQAFFGIWLPLGVAYVFSEASSFTPQNRVESRS